MRILASWFVSVALGILVAMSSQAFAGDGASRVPKPVIQKGMGDKCVEDTQYMRREHMEVLEHHRDRTVHEGIRTKQHSLKNCINCHATPDASGQRTVLGKDHFCQSCHSYAAVTIDCFECHSSKPSGDAAVKPITSTQAGANAQLATNVRHDARFSSSLVPSTLTIKDIARAIK
jgi:hypothetical protein